MPGKRKLTNQVKAIQYFIEQGDADMVFAIVNNAPQLTDKAKLEIQNELRDFFDEFENTNDTQLIPRAGKCPGCYAGRTGFMYTGNVSKKKQPLLFEQKNGNIQSITSCGAFALNKTIKSKKKKPVKGKTRGK